ncbi:MAG: class II aldolase/adducin family protein, partial [Nocardioides sp.]|uniref:class II aldolase/adducin family protein n=1 Tax=Nocardioides sp. TaxID=35761 RepID=UPI0039E31F81
EVAGAARALAEARAFVGTAGNVSARAGSHVAITGTGVRLATCTRADVTVVTVGGGIVEGTLEPSSELGLHLDLYRASATTSAVVHTHAPASTAVACVLDRLPVIHYQQLLLGGDIRVAPYATFGSPELATAVATAIEGRQAALMGSHGSVAVGASLSAAVGNALLLEWLADLHLRASRLGTPRELSAAEQEDVIHAALARGYGAPRSHTAALEDQEQS